MGLPLQLISLNPKPYGLKGCKQVLGGTSEEYTTTLVQGSYGWLLKIRGPFPGIHGAHIGTHSILCNTNTLLSSTIEFADLLSLLPKLFII